MMNFKKLKDLIARVSDKIFTWRNFVLLVLWVTFFFLFSVGVAHKSLGWRFASFPAAILNVMVILIILDFFRTGTLPEKNKELNDAEEIIRGFFDNAVHQILIFSGGLNPHLYTEGVIEALKKTQTGGRDVEIQVLVAFEDSRQKELINWLSQNVPYFILNKDYAPHFIVVDGLHVRAEHIHKERGLFRTADLNLYAPRLAQFYINRFESLKKKAHPTETQQKD